MAALPQDVSTVGRPSADVRIAKWAADQWAGDNAKLLDPNEDALQGGTSVLVEGDKIKEVSQKPIKAPKADVVDCAGKTLMPAIINTHTHPSDTRDASSSSGSEPSTVSTVPFVKAACGDAR